MKETNMTWGSIKHHELKGKLIQALVLINLYK
jgi:hypothetical protein